jgi:hypothetical protein
MNTCLDFLDFQAVNSSDEYECSTDDQDHDYESYFAFGEPDEDRDIYEDGSGEHFGH